MKVVIIGGKGYIGKNLDFYLRQRGIISMVYDVHDFDEPNYKQIDITNPSSVAKIDKNVDCIFMLAGLTGTYAGFDKYSIYNSINEVGLMNLLDDIRRSKYRPKIIFPSTRLIYKGADKPLKETDKKETKTIYAVNKLACEGILQAYKASFDIPYTIFRICVPYGNLITTDYSFGIVGHFIKQASEGKDITLYGGGNIKRTFTHMEDVCHQLVEGSFNPDSNGEIYNIGGETHSLREAAEIVAAKYKTNVIDVPWPERDYRIESGHTYFDDTKIRKLINIGNYKKLIDFSKDI